MPDMTGFLKVVKQAALDADEKGMNQIHTHGGCMHIPCRSAGTGKAKSGLKLPTICRHWKPPGGF